LFLIYFGSIIKTRKNAIVEYLDEKTRKNAIVEYLDYKTRKNAIVEYLDYQYKEERYSRVPRLSDVTQLKGPKGDGDI